VTNASRAPRALVTGHAGFAGGHLLDALREDGYEVWGADRVAPAAHPASRDAAPAAPDARDAPAAAPSCTSLTGDLTDYAFVREAVEAARPDLVVHLAAMTFGRPSGPEDRRFFEVNVDATRYLCEALVAADLRPRLLVTGSSAAYGAPPRAAQPITEATLPRPQTLYAASKVCQELVALTYHRTHDLPVVVTRAFNHTGPGEHPHFACSAFARQIAEIEAGHREPPLRVGNLEAYRDFSDVRDVVRGYLAAALGGEPGECYNVCSGVARRMADILDMLIALGERPIPVELDPGRLQASDVPYQCGSRERLARATGWQPRIAFERTLADLLESWRRRLAAGDRS
jgi:GDP-4-dehydro-6-deoxy-D-mannose reductase